MLLLWRPNLNPKKKATGLEYKENPQMRSKLHKVITILKL
jgi:hypothetical protein